MGAERRRRVSYLVYRGLLLVFLQLVLVLAVTAGSVRLGPGSPAMMSSWRLSDGLDPGGDSQPSAFLAVPIGRN